MRTRTIVLALVGLVLVGITAWFALRESVRLAPSANRALPALVQSPGADAAALQAQAVRQLFDESWPDIKGAMVPMRSYLGKPVVVNFWATWCAPCVQEMPALDEMARSLPGVQFVGVGIDTKVNIEQFLEKVPVGYTLLVAGHAAIANIRELGNTAGGLPFTILIDAQGKMVETLLGQVSAETLFNKIKVLALK